MMPRRSERGSMSVELVLLTPVFVALLLLVVALGRIQAARSDLDAAARGAARAASIKRDAASARRAGDTAARGSLAQHGYRCRELAVNVDTAGFTAGGTVAASVTCTVTLDDVTGLGIPGAHTSTARFAEPIDRYRGTR